ncbi:MAG: galactose mutarotase [Cyanobacteria bacterium REEB67]|nr:galactose mutarotase [Cyanobacteria bacterium REEB67]
MQKTDAACSKKLFGKTRDGEIVDLITLKNSSGCEARVITYGATLTGMDVPDKSGKADNVVLGFDNIGDYETKSPYFGATVGRVANRIARGTFDLDGTTYKLAINNGPNTLHGGLKAFDKKVWTIEKLEQSPPSVTFKLHSKNMDEGFPGDVDVEVCYSLAEDNALKITYAAKTDKSTPLNLTNHAYFNLAGAGRGTILDHILKLNCSKYTPVDQDLIPTGEIADVSGSPFDFTAPHTIGARIAEVAGGYDHNFCIEPVKNVAEHQGAVVPESVQEVQSVQSVRKVQGVGSLAPNLAAVARDPESGRILKMLTTEPGVQFYTGNFLDGTISGIGGIYVKHAGFTFEAQHYPDAVHQPNFPSIILHAGEKYNQVTIYKFSVR